MSAYGRGDLAGLRANQREGWRPLPRLIQNVPIVGITFSPWYPRSIHLLGAVIGFAVKASGDDGVRPLLNEGFRQLVDGALVRGCTLPVRLDREPDNPVDLLAVSVTPTTVETGMLGHLPATTHGHLAHRVAKSLDAGDELEAWISRVRIHPDHWDQPGIDVTLRRGG